MEQESPLESVSECHKDLTSSSGGLAAVRVVLDHSVNSCTPGRLWCIFLDFTVHLHVILRQMKGWGSGEWSFRC